MNPMDLLIFINLPGLVIFVLAFGATFGAAYLTGVADEGPLMVLLGPLCFVMDLAYRWRRPSNEWWKPATGGAFFFIPVWLLGIVWLVLGVAYTIQDLA